MINDIPENLHSFWSDAKPLHHPPVGRAFEGQDRLGDGVLFDVEC
jgi:hypothetical protein